MPKGDENLKPLNKNILDRDSIPVLGVDTPGTSSIDVTSISKKRDLGGQNLKDFQKSTGTGASILGKDNLSNKDYFNNLIEENKTIQNDIKAYQQSTADKIGNGIVKFGGRVFTSMIGSTAGTIYGLYAWARDGEFRSFYDNEFQDSLDGINDYLAEEFKHYYTSDPNDWEVGNFIFDKVFDGLGFAVGAVGSSMIGGGATNALTKSLGWSKYLKAGAVKKLALAEANAKKGLLSSDDLLKSIDKYNKSITRIDKLSKIPHTTAQMTTGAVYESGVEARHTFDEIREELVRNYKAEFGYEPKGEALKNITEIAGESANGVFAANMALVGSSNFIQFGRHLGLDYQDINKIFGKKALAKVIETREGASQLSTKFAKRGSAIARGTKTILKNPVMESQEEMLQSVISETGKDYAKKKYNNDGKADLKDLLDSSVKSFKGVYTSKEGWEEGLLGAIVGSIGVYNASKKADGSRRLPSLAVIESVKDWRSDENFRNSIVQMLNDNDVASSLTAGLEHTLRDGRLERAKDGALALNRQREYKDAEDEQFHSYVMSRIKAGMYSQIGSELNTLRNTPLDEFKDMFGISQEVEYTETDKLKQIESFERRAKAIEESNKFITSNYSQLEDFHDELIFDHAMVKRITERRDNIAKQINDLTGQAVVTLNVTDEETGKRIPATEVFKDVDAEHKINEDIYTGLYNDYVALDKKQKAHLDNFKEVISNKEARDERLNEQEAVQKDAEKQANKVKRKKEKTQAKAKEEERANQSDMIAKAEEDDLLENSQVLFEEEAALKELDDLEVVTPEDSVLKEALAKDKDAREKVNDAINNKVKDKSGVNPDTPSDERTDYQRDKEINEQSDDTKVAPKDYTKDTKTKKNVEEEIAKANRGQVTEGYENEEVQKETTGVYRIGKRLVYAYNAIAVRTRNFIETATGIKESSDKIDTHTSLDILHPDLIKAGDKVEITLNNDSEIIFNDANGEPQTYKNEVGTPNQVMEIRINDKLIGYLHDLTYITENRVVPIVEGKNNIQANIDALTNVRQNIFNELQTKQSYQVTVTSKTAGQIRVKVNEKYDSPLTETIANDTRPQILVVKDGTIYHNAQPVSESWLSDELLFDLEESHKSDDDLTFAEKFNGATLIAVPGANGKYIMSLVRNGSVQESNLPIRQTVLEILDAYINQDIEKLAEYGLSDVENNEMYDELISKYINKFIYTNSSLDNPYYMYLGISDNNMPQIAFKDKEGNGLVYTGNTESVARKKLIDRIDNALISTNLRALVDKETVRLSNGKEMSYQEFLHNNLYANFVGENINTSKGTIRSYTDNPIISLDFEDNHVKFGKKLPAKKDRPTESELLDSITEKSETQVTDIETKKADIERRRQEELEIIKNIGEDKLKEGRENTKKLVESLKQRYPATSVQGIIIRILEKLIDFSKYSTIIDSDYLNGRNASGQATWFGMIISQETFDGILAGKEFEVHTFIHEFIHGFTTSKISDYNIEKQGLIPGFKSKLTAKEKNAIEQLQRIFEKVKRDNPKSKEYGFTNLDEFIAEAFSNISFQYTLKNTKAEGKKSNLFSEFIEAIGDLLFEQLERWAKRFNKEIPERSTITGILEDVLAWTEELIDQNNKLAYIATNEEINAKYDTELAALENNNSSEGNTNQQKADIEKRRQEELNSLVSEQEFIKSIFPDTKVKQIVYHGSKKADEIRKSSKFLSKKDSGYLKQDTQTDNGIYFSASIIEAATYADISTEEEFKLNKNKVISTVLNIKNPKEFSSHYTDIDALEDAIDKKLTEEEKQEYINSGEGIEFAGAINDKYLEKLKKEGYDSVIESEREYVVFEPEQIHILTEEEQAKIYNEDNVDRINAKYDVELDALNNQTASQQNQSTEQQKADIERRRQEELNNIGQKAVQRRLQDLREANSEKQIAQAIINIEKNIKAGAKITKEEQDFVNQKRQELKDKGFEIVELTGKIWNVGLNLEVLNVRTLEDSQNLTQEEIDALEKELENRKRRREKLKARGLSEQEIDNQLEDSISIMTTIQPQLNKDGKMEQSAKVNILTIEVSQAEGILERSKKNPNNAQQLRKDKINAKYDAELAALESENNSENISEKEWNDFVDNNNVSERILNIIANKIINNESFSIKEQAIHSSNIRKIENILNKIRNSQNNSLSSQPKNEFNSNQIEAKKADIERRRQEELRNRTIFDRYPTEEDGEFTITDNSGIYRVSLTGKLQMPDFDEQQNIISWNSSVAFAKELKEKAKKDGFTKTKESINAKYDAELAALEGKTKSKEVKEISKDNPFLKSNFKRSKKSPKKNFKPEDLFKNLNPIIDADKGTLLPTKHVRDITMSLVNTAYNIIQSSENKSTVEMFKTLTAGLQEFGDYYESIGDTNGMKAVETVLNNFDTFKPLVAQRLRDLGLSIKGGKVSEILFNAEEREEVFTDAEEDSLYGDTPDVTKSYKEDGILGDNPIDKLSYKIKVALATIPNNEANILGMDSYYEMETVYNSIMEVLANIPDMSIEKLIEELKANSKVKPYLEHVAVNILENPETETSLKYMLNSHFKMAYITKELAKANDSKDIKIIESNRVALSNLILEDWLNNGNLTNLFNTDETINSQYVVEVVQPLWAKALETKTVADTKAFLNSVGISISTEALEELRANSKNIRGIETSWDLLFTHKNRGAFKKIRETLNKEVPEGTHPLSTDRYVRSLASVEARFKEDVATKSSRDVEGNSIFSYIVPTFITDRFNRLKDKNGRVDRSYVSHLRSIPFLSRSWYLEMLADNKKFRDIFRLSIVDSLKVEGIEGKKFNNLTKKEQIIGQIAYFVNGDQGDVDGKISKFFVAKSDKSILHLLTALRHRTTSTPDKIRNNEWSEEDKRQIIDNIVGAEYSRIKDAQERESKDVNFDDIKGYNPFLFYSFSELNHLSQIRDDYGDLINFEDAREVMWQAILPSLKDMHDSTKDELEKFGIIDSKGKLDYVDKNYIANNFKGDVDYFVRDYTLNYMIATFNYTQIFQGDVAFAYKEAKQKDYLDLIKAELIDKSVELSHANMFKRSAKDMAPAVRSASSIDPEYAEYSQIVLADAFNSSLNIEQLKDIFGEDSSTVNDYSSIEGTDAQEVTLLTEHINVMYHHGKLTDEQYNRFYPTAKAGRDYSPEDLKDLIEVLKNPMKPFFGQNQYMDNYGAEVPIYIKTSSFPLVPQLIKGTAFETLEKIMRNNKISRAAFASGVKLGAFKTIDAWNKKLDVDGNPTKFTDGTFNEKELNRAIKEDGAVLRLNRDYFGIQQEVPYDANKKEILEGTQLMKLIQHGISDVEVLKEFNQLHIDIVEKQLQNLLDELEVVDKGDGKYTTPNLKKLRTLLREELIERGSYNENDLAALEIREVDSNGTLEFNTPLWANPKSIQFESLLNSIINKRVLRSKMPGKSYVLGTEEGWLGNSVEIQKIDERKLVGTRYNSKKGLRPQRKGYVNKTTGEKLEYEQYKALSKKDRDTFDEVVFPAQVLMAKGKYTDKQMIGYRIPTQGLNSMSAMEVVGYLPDYMADLLIAPRDFTKQMGSDFDIDKIYVHRWHETRAGNRTSVETTQTGWEYYQEEREQQILKRDVLRTIDQKIIDMFNKASIKVNGEKFAVEVEADDLKEYYDKIVTKTLTEEDYKAIYDKKIKQNRIMTIYWDTLTDPNNLKAILKPLDFGNLPEVIKNLKGSKAQHTLSPLRQIENYQNGNAGKFGVAVTSHASTTNALIQVQTSNIGIRGNTGFAFIINGNKVEPTSFMGKETLNGKSTKADVISAFQSASVDNIKELLINIINYNKHTHDAFITLAYLGLDDTYISYLLAQPIIKDFVANKEALSSAFEETRPSEIDDKAYAKTFEDLGLDLEVLKEYRNLWNKPFSEEQLLNAINNPEDIESQVILLAKFKELSKVGKEVNELIRALQPATSGIGKNRIAAETKQSRASTILKNSEILYGVDSLFGKIQGTDATGVVVINPTTIAGQGYEVLRKSNNLLNKLFPINTIGRKLSEAIAELQDSDAKYFTEKQLTQMTKFAKSYLFSYALDLYGKENAAEYRKRLMVGDNTLAHRWEAYKKENPKNQLSLIIRTKVSKDPLKVSTINYNAATADRTDDIKNVTSLLDMLATGTPLEKELAEDTIAYAYLTGGNQDANSLLKFIPNTYLSLVNLGKEVNDLAEGLISGDINFAPLTKQFLQHYPYFVDTNINDVTILEDKTIAVKGKDLQDFVSIKVDKKSRLYQATNIKGIYKPVDSLGTYLYSEANFGDLNTTSIESKNNVDKVEVKAEPTPLPSKRTTSVADVAVPNVVAKVNTNEAKYRIGENSAKVTLDIIAGEGITEEYRNLAKALSDVIGNEVTIKFDESGQLEKAEANGSYLNNVISLNKDSKDMKDPQVFERVILHEAMHAVLSNVIANPQTKQQKDIIDSLQAVLSIAKQNRYKFSDKNGLDNLDEFISELMTDYIFQRELATVEFNKDISLLQRIWKLIKDIIQEVTGEAVTQSSIEAVGELIQTLPKIESSVSQNTQKVLDEALTYKGLKIINTKYITTQEGTKGGAKLRREANQILINREFLQQKYKEKAWTNPRKLVEVIHGTKIESFAKRMAEDQFTSYEQFENFVMEHEYQHSLYSRQDYLKDHPKTTKAQYENEINMRALAELNILFKPFKKPPNQGGIPIFDPITGEPMYSPKKKVNYQNNTNESDEDYIASEKTIRDLAARMSDRIGIPVRFESDRSKQYKGKLENGTAVINLAYATLDTPIHEILGHPIIRAIKNRSLKQEDSSFNKLYENLLEELSTTRQGKEVLDRVKRDYKYKKDNSNRYRYEYVGDSQYKHHIIDTNKKWDEDGYITEFETKEEAEVFTETLPYTLEEQQEEAIVELLGLYTADRLDKVKDGKLISLLKRLLKEMKAFMRSLIGQKEVEIDKLPDNMTLGDLADLLAYSNSKLILPGNEVIYTTPDNQKFKTYQEASNHISNLAKSVEDVDLSSVKLKKEESKRINNLKQDINELEKQLEEKNNSILPKDLDFLDTDNEFLEIIYKKEGNKWFKYVEGDKEKEISSEEILELYKNMRYGQDSYDNISLETRINELKKQLNNLLIEENNTNVNSFIEKNKQYEQSKEIIEEWKEVNNIQYDPQEVYNRGQGFYSVVGAYSDFDVELMFQNLLAHIDDNQKAGGEFIISAFTKPLDTKINHLEGGGGKIKFKIYPKSEDIKWAANTDVYSGSVWDASQSVSKDKKSELIGVSYTKYPSLRALNAVEHKLGNIIDNLSHHHNELGIALTGKNFRLEYDDNVPYSTKKLLDNINSILDQKYGKLEDPTIKINEDSKRLTELYNRLDNLMMEDMSLFTVSDFEDLDNERYTAIQNEIQATENEIDRLKEKLNIKSDPRTIENRFPSVSIEEISNKYKEEYLDTIEIEQYYDYIEEEDVTIQGFALNNYGDSLILDEVLSSQSKTIFKTLSEAESVRQKVIKEAKKIQGEKLKPIKYTQAEINQKIAALKQAAKKYPRSLIRSEVKSLSSGNLFEDFLPFQKLNNLPKNDIFDSLSKDELDDYQKRCK